MKICRKCLVELPPSSFSINKKFNIISSWCNPCRIAAGKFAAEAKRTAKKLNAKGHNYASRNGNLRRLGFNSYRDYLASELWRSVRKKVYEIKGRSCYLCSKPATELHHNRYHTKDLIGKRLHYINPVCRSCHEGIEFKDGKKATLNQAKLSFKRIRKASLVKSRLELLK